MSEPARAGAGGRALRAVAWGVTVAALAWVGWTTPWSELGTTLAAADAWLFWGALFGLYVIVFAFDTASLRWMLGRFTGAWLPWSVVGPVRGATYVLGVLNYGAGTAAMSVWFRRWGVSWADAGATLVLFLLVDLGLLIVTATLGIPWLPEPWRAGMTWLGVAFVVGAVAHVVFWSAPWSWGPLEAVRRHPALQVFRKPTLRDYVVMGALRAPVIACFVAMHAATLDAFEIPIPFSSLLVYVPLLSVIVALPISISGMGTVQLAQRALYLPWLADLDAVGALARIDAYALACLPGFILPRIVIGLLCLRASQRLLLQPPPDADASAPAGPSP